MQYLTEQLNQASQIDKETFNQIVTSLEVLREIVRQYPDKQSILIGYIENTDVFTRLIPSFETFRDFATAFPCMQHVLNRHLFPLSGFFRP